MTELVQVKAFFVEPGDRVFDDTCVIAGGLSIEDVTDALSEKEHGLQCPLCHATKSAVLLEFTPVAEGLIDSEVESIGMQDVFQDDAEKVTRYATRLMEIRNKKDPEDRCKEVSFLLAYSVTLIGSEDNAELRMVLLGLVDLGSPFITHCVKSEI